MPHQLADDSQQQQAAQRRAKHLPAPGEQLALAERCLDVVQRQCRQADARRQQPQACRQAQGFQCVVLDEDVQRPVPEVQRIGDQTEPDQRLPAQQAANPSVAGAVGPDQQGGAKHRRQRREAGERSVAVVEEHRQENRRYPEGGRQLQGPLRMPAATARQQRQRGTRQEFPGAHRQEEEGTARSLAHRPDAGRQR